MERFKKRNGQARLRFTREELTQLRAFLLILATEADVGEERARNTVRNTHGELGRDQLAYWQTFKKALTVISDRAGKGVDTQEFARAVMIVTQQQEYANNTEG